MSNPLNDNDDVESTDRAAQHFAASIGGHGPSPTDWQSLDADAHYGSAAHDRTSPGAPAPELELLDED